jgi:hypothetical protein
MSKRDLADRILDEVRALRRPASIVDESGPLSNTLLTAPVSAASRRPR